MKTSTHHLQALGRFIRVANSRDTVWFPLKDIVGMLSLRSTSYVTENYLSLGDTTRLSFNHSGRPAQAITLSAVKKLASISSSPNKNIVAQWATLVANDLTGSVHPLESSNTQDKVSEGDTVLPENRIVRSGEVQVCGSNILAVVNSAGHTLFSPRTVCEALGIDWSSQRKKIQEDPVLNSGVVIAPHVASDGKNYQTLLLPTSVLTGWLFTIRRADEKSQSKLNAFRVEGCAVLNNWALYGTNAAPSQTAAVNHPDYASEIHELRTKVLRLESENILLREEAVYSQEQELRKQREPIAEQLEKLDISLQRMETQRNALHESYEAKQAELTALSTPPAYSINSYEIRG